MTHTVPDVTKPLRWPLGEGLAQVWWIAGSLITIKLNSELTGGHLGMWEWDAPRGATTPLHVHEIESEEFVILEGTARFFIGDERIDGGPGDVVMLPRQIPHAYQITSERARVITMVTPGGQEAMFLEAGNPVTGPQIAPDPALMLEIGPKYGTRLVGPPPPFEG
jgi:quercetin dioxygenase-like cupin family protein